VPEKRQYNREEIAVQNKTRGQASVLFTGLPFISAERHHVQTEQSEYTTETTPVNIILYITHVAERFDERVRKSFCVT